MKITKQNNKSIFLTFDDGPTPEVTPWVLALLDKYNFKATFFCIAKNAEIHNDILFLTKQKEHTIANHGYEHLNGWKTPTKKYIENTIKGAQILNTNLFRPPYGKITPLQWFFLKKNKIKIILWNYLVKDFSLKPEMYQNEYTKLINKTKNKSIIVFHDSLKSEPFLKEYLEKYFQWLKNNNYFTEVLNADSAFLHKNFVK